MSIRLGSTNTLERMTCARSVVSWEKIDLETNHTDGPMEAWSRHANYKRCRRRRTPKKHAQHTAMPSSIWGVVRQRRASRHMAEGEGDRRHIGGTSVLSGTRDGDNSNRARHRAGHAYTPEQGADRRDLLLALSQNIKGRTLRCRARSGHHTGSPKSGRDEGARVVSVAHPVSFACSIAHWISA